MQEKRNSMTTLHRNDNSRKAGFEKLEALHQRCKGGDLEAKNKIAKIIVDYGNAYALKKFGARKKPEAEDFAQQFYLAYEKSAARIESINYWLVRVSANLAGEFLRKKYKWNRWIDSAPEDQFDPDGAERKIIDGLHVQNALRVTNRREKRIIYLRFWHDWSFEAIAASMQLKKENVKKIYQRALKKIAGALASES